MQPFPKKAKPDAPAPTALTEVDIGNISERYQQELKLQLGLRAEQEADWVRYVKAYKGEPEVKNKVRPWPNASNIVVGLTAIYTDSIIARIMQSIFQIEPHWVVTSTNKSSESAAKPLERYLDWCRQYAWDQYRAVKPMVLEMTKLGTGIIQTSWVNEPFYRFNSDTGQTEYTGVRIGPRPRWVPREDFLIPAGFNRVNTSEDGEKAPWVATRQWYSAARLMTLAHTGYFENVDAVLKCPDSETVLRQLRSNDAMTGGFDDQHDGSSNLYALWQFWFQWDLDGDGCPEEYIMVFHPESKTIVRFRDNPYVGGTRMFVHCPFIEQEGQFDGIGIPEMAEHYQAEVSTIHNQRRDNAHLANTQMLAVRRGSGVTEKASFFPGKIWLLSDPQDVRPINFGQNYILTIQEEQQSIAMAERRVGISDINLGRESSPLGRAAATTVMQLMQEGNRRFDLNTTELRRALSEQGRQIIELYQTHGLPKPFAAGSPESILDPDDASIVRKLLETRDDLTGLVSISVNVSTQAINKEMERQSNLQLYQLATGYISQMMQYLPVFMNPQVPPEGKAVVLKMMKGADQLFQRVLQSHGTYDTADQLLVADMFAELAAKPQPPPPNPQQMMQGPQGQGQPPAQEQMPAGNGQTPPMDPQMMAAMMQRMGGRGGMQ